MPQAKRAAPVGPRAHCIIHVVTHTSKAVSRVPHLSPKKQATLVKNCGNPEEMMAEGIPQNLETTPGALKTKRQNELTEQYKRCADGKTLATHTGQETGMRHPAPLFHLTISLLHNHR